MNKKFFFVFLFAFLIRLIALNQSLWLDEAVTANVVKNLDFFQIVTKFSPSDFHPPLYYLFMKLWTNFFGYSEIALRIPSVLFSLMTGYLVYKIASLFHGSIAGVFAMAFFLFNPLIVYYSQEARMYMMATFFLTIALYFFWKFVIAIRQPAEKQSLPAGRQVKKEIATAAFGGLAMTMSFLTFYGSIFLIAAMFVYLLYKKQYKYFIVSLLIFIVSLLLISPLLYKQLVNSKIALANITNWSLVLGKANIKNLLLIPIKFSIGRISFWPKWLYWGIAGIWTGFVFFVIKTVFKKDSLLWLYLFIFPLILGFVVSFFTPMLQYFRFIYLIPIMTILLSFSLSTGHKYHRFGVIVAGGFIIFSLVYLINPAFHREDWKGLVKSLPKDRPVYMITSSSDPVKYYNRTLKINELRELIHLRLEKQITVIPYTADIYGFNYKKILKENNYYLISKKTFRGLELEFFVFNN